MERKLTSQSHVIQHVTASIAVAQEIINDDFLVKKIEKAASLCVDAYKSGNKVILAGNGGSAADAQHIAAEFVGRFKMERPALPSLSLATDTSMLTAIGNDYGYEHTFVRQLQANGKQGDVFIGITTSGNSMNIVKAFETCSDIGIKTIGLLGVTGGQARENVDVELNVPSSETALIQEAHIMIGHIICSYVETTLFGN